MPFRSKAQARFMFAAQSRGQLPRGTAQRWADATPSIKRLPERLKPTRMAAGRKKRRARKRGTMRGTAR